MRRPEVAECRRVAEREGDHGLARERVALLLCDLLDDRADWVGCPLTLGAHAHMPFVFLAFVAALVHDRVARAFAQRGALRSLRE
eukprot:4696706-Prymnesium_polylepis.2